MSLLPVVLSVEVAEDVPLDFLLICGVAWDALSCFSTASVIDDSYKKNFNLKVCKNYSSYPITNLKANLPETYALARDGFS